MDPFNLGEPDGYRVPDHGWLRDEPNSTYLPTAAIVVEILSPDDETFEKLPLYAAHEVDEVIIVDPVAQRVRIFALAYGRDEESGTSTLLNVGVGELSAAIRWPD